MPIFWTFFVILIVAVGALMAAIALVRSRGGTELFGHPVPVFMLFLTEMWERFSYYGMRAIFMLYMTKYLLLDPDKRAGIYGDYTGLVYLTPILGGMIADRFLGLQRTILIGGTMMAIGQFLMAAHAWGAPGMGEQAANSLLMMGLGLLLLIVGNGMFKPNISTIVGQLYPEGGARRDAGFTIFYMGINMGAFFGPLICGPLAELVNWRYGFLAAGIGMMIGTVTFLFGRGMLEGRGLHPAGAKAAVAESKAAVPTQPPNWLTILGGALPALVLMLYLVREQLAAPSIVDKARALLWPVAVASCCSIYIFLKQRCTKEEFRRVNVIYVLGICSMFFWAAFEQAGSSLTTFADEHTERSIFGFAFPASIYQSVNSIFILSLAPVFTALWTFLAKRNQDPSTPMKMVYGIFVNGLSFAVMIPAALIVAQGSKAGPLWLVALYFLATCGELCLSPVGLSMVTKLAPARYAAMLMGLWFLLANSFGNKLAGTAEALMADLGSLKLFIGTFGLLSGAALVLFFLVPWLRREMGGVH